MAEINEVNETMGTMDTMGAIVDTIDEVSSTDGKIMTVVACTVGAVAALAGGVYCIRKFIKKKGKNDEPGVDVRTDKDIENFEEVENEDE